MLDARFSHLYFYQSLNRLQRGLSAIAELLVVDLLACLAAYFEEILTVFDILPDDCTIKHL